jgi:hypothetical protein
MVTSITKSSITVLGASLVFVGFSSFATAAAVDLSTWTDDGTGSWNFSGTGDTVLQTVNTSQPAILYEAGSNAQGTSLSGSISVNTTSDDDFIGFVLGYQGGESTSATADFWLIDWKQGTQNASAGQGLLGLALSHVTNGSASDPFTSYWPHANGVTEVARGNTLGSTGWADNTSYDFDLIFTSSLIEVYIDDVLEISYSSIDNAAAFTDGAFGFYNFSQQTVQYSAITEDVVEVSDPSISGLMAVALGGLCYRRFKKRR